MWTTNPGCISKPSFTPCWVAKAACSPQYGMTFSLHCHSSSSPNSFGQAQVTQFGKRAVSESPGAAAEEVDPVNLQALRELDGSNEHIVCRRRDLALRMKRIAVARERADLEPA